MKTLHDVWTAISSFFTSNKRLVNAFSKLAGVFGRKAPVKDDGRRVYNVPTPQSKPRKKVGGSNNHNQGEPKYRRKMAVASNRINRERCRDWKH